MTIGELRESLKMSQRAFAQAIGVARSSLGDYERGETTPNESILKKINELFGVDIEASRKKLNIIVQSPMGGNITVDEIAERVGDADAVYVRVDQNKAYWVKGDQTGSVDLW